MFAVIELGGKQYKVVLNDIISVEKLDLKEGEVIRPKVLLLSKDDKTVTGNPAPKAVVEAVVMDTYKADKIIVYKYKAKKNERKKRGHRQQYTRIKINAIG